MRRSGSSYITLCAVIKRVLPPSHFVIRSSFTYTAVCVRRTNLCSELISIRTPHVHTMPVCSRSRDKTAIFHFNRRNAFNAKFNRTARCAMTRTCVDSACSAKTTRSRSPSTRVRSTRHKRMTSRPTSTSRRYRNSPATIPSAVQVRRADRRLPHGKMRYGDMFAFGAEIPRISLISSAEKRDLLPPLAAAPVRGVIYTSCHVYASYVRSTHV